jgi:hypothetical protein
MGGSRHDAADAVSFLAAIIMTPAQAFQADNLPKQVFS